jgi:multiple sugar transport system ATP-binding protein
MSTVEIRGIVKKYGPVTVLQNLDLSVADGEFLVLLGPSGCGKTTLLNMLAGLVETTQGEILIDGKDVTDVDPSDRGLAMVFQSYALYPTKTVHGNLKFGLGGRGLGGDEIERRIQWAAKLLQLEALMGRKPAQLSGGQRQRVAIGRALVKQVGLFLFDEPLSNLDAKLRLEMRIEIKKLHDRLKNTVVYVTHDQVEAMTMATRIAVMDKGVIQQIGSPDDIYDRPANVFVADFVGSPAMNMIDATAHIADGRAMAAPDGGGDAFDLSNYSWRAPPADGQRLKIGFRPEHLAPPDESMAGRTMTLTLPVQFIERSGPEAIALLDFFGKVVSARIEPSMVAKFTPGRGADVRLALDKVSVFDAASGLRA